MRLGVGRVTEDRNDVYTKAVSIMTLGCGTHHYCVT